MSRNIWLMPDGYVYGITGGNNYKAALGIFDRNRELYDLKAQASVDAGEIVGFERFLLDTGYALFTDKETVLPVGGLSAAQVVYVRAYIGEFSETQISFLVEKGYLTQEQSQENSINYYVDILRGMEDKYEQDILDTYGNTHDFNMYRSNIAHAFSKLRELEALERSEETDKEISSLVWTIRARLVRLQVFAEGEMKPIRMRERLLKMDLADKEGKLGSYVATKRDNLRRILGVEVSV